MNSILHYIGKMKDVYISKYIPENTKIYVEPFAGSFNCGFNLMESGFFGKTVLNDKDYKVYNFWCCIKDNPLKVVEEIYNIYDSVIKCNSNNNILELEKYNNVQDRYKLAAYEYLYRYNLSFFNKENKNIKRINIDTDLFVETSIRLINTTIENMDVFDLIDKYDTKETLFMMDPPYNVKNIDKYYRLKGSTFNHKKLNERLNTVSGKWIVRYNKEDYTYMLYFKSNIMMTTEKIIGKSNYKEIYYANF